MLPGHDTTASALAWTLYSLAEHPHFQRQCQQEIDSLLQDRNTDDITWSVAQTLPVNVVCVLARSQVSVFTHFESRAIETQVS